HALADLPSFPTRRSSDLGKLFRPMAVTISLAVIGALVLTLTLIPVLMSLLFRRPPSERESPLLRWLRRPYLPGLRWCQRRSGLSDRKSTRLNSSHVAISY